MQRPPARAAFVLTTLPRLFTDYLEFVDYPEVAIGVAGAGRKEELILLAVQRRSASELDSPEPADLDCVAGGVLDRALEFSSRQAIAIDCAGAGVVRD